MKAVARDVAFTAVERPNLRSNVEKLPLNSGRQGSERGSSLARELDTVEHW
jgi:hypothetical protein